MSELACKVWHEPGSKPAECWLNVGGIGRDRPCRYTKRVDDAPKGGCNLIRGCFSKISSRGFHGFRGSLEMLKLIVFVRGLFSNACLVVLLCSVVLVVCSVKTNHLLAKPSPC